MPKAASVKKSSVSSEAKTAAAAVAAAGPRNWTKMYRAIVMMRRVLFAAVDVIGCHMLADREADAETQRFQTLLALMLSSQTRDQATAAAMKKLIADIPGGCNAPAVAKGTEAQIKKCIESVCFYNNKAKFISKTAKNIVSDHGGVVPSSLKELVALPGVGYKMASIFLECADGKVESIGIDVHMFRNFKRYGWIKSDCKSPDEAMKEMMSWLPLSYWRNINEIMVGFGQLVCKAATPICATCTARHWCPSADLTALQKADDKKRGFAATDAALGGNKREVLDMEDIEKTLLTTRATTEKLTQEHGFPRAERMWMYPKDDDAADGEPMLIQTQHVSEPAAVAAAGEKKKAADKKKKQ